MQAWNGSAGAAARALLARAAPPNSGGRLGYDQKTGRCRLFIVNPTSRAVWFTRLAGAAAYTEDTAELSLRGYRGRTVYVGTGGELVTGAGTAKAPTATDKFQTPTGNIVCNYFPTQEGQPETLRCDIKSGLVPIPEATASDHCGELGGTWVIMSVGRRGPAKPGCVTDAGVHPGEVIAYGQTWKQHGFACVSHVTGLRCEAPSGNGFFLSRQRSYAFAHG
jgi:hypothetical protein